MVNVPFGQCRNCGERLGPRGGLPPRFCPRCGVRVGKSTDVAQAVSVVESEGVSGLAVASLIVGLVGLPLLCFPFGIPAIVLGVLARMKIEESRGRLWGNGLALAGIVLGVISSGLSMAFCASAL